MDALSGFLGRGRCHHGCDETLLETALETPRRDIAQDKPEVRQIYHSTQPMERARWRGMWATTPRPQRRGAAVNQSPYLHIARDMQSIDGTMRHWCIISAITAAIHAARRPGPSLRGAFRPSSCPVSTSTWI